MLRDKLATHTATKVEADNRLVSLGPCVGSCAGAWWGRTSPRVSAAAATAWEAIQDAVGNETAAQATAAWTHAISTVEHSVVDVALDAVDATGGIRTQWSHVATLFLVIGLPLIVGYALCCACLCRSARRTMSTAGLERPKGG